MSLISRIAPRWALKRQIARMQLEKMRAYYEGASSKGRGKKWRARAVGPRGESDGDRATLARRARDICRNDGIAKRAVDLIAGYTVGTGIRPSIKNRNGVKDPVLQEIFNKWAKSTLVDARRKRNLYAIQNACMRAMVKGGEALVLRRTDRSLLAQGLPPLSLLAVEGEYLDATYDDLRQDWQGIRIDDNVPVGYHIYQGDPYDTNSLDSRLVPADQVIHLFEEDRLGQIRGISWLAPILMRLRDLDEYSDAELMRRKVAACFAAFVESSPDINISDEEKESFANIEPGAVEYLTPGQSVKFSQPPTQVDYDPFVRSTLQRIAMGCNVPYELLSGNLSDVNFSSARIGQIPFRAMLEEWQYLLVVPQLCDRIWSWFVEAAVVAGFTGFDGATAEWIAPRVPMLDVDKETEAAKREMRSGMKSISEAIRERGRDPEEVLAEIAADNQRLDQLGIILDSDPRKTTNAGHLHTDTGEG